MEDLNALLDEAIDGGVADLTEGSYDDDSAGIKKFCDKAVNELKKKFDVKAVRQWWWNRKYPGTAAHFTTSKSPIEAKWGMTATGFRVGEIYERGGYATSPQVTLYITLLDGGRSMGKEFERPAGTFSVDKYVSQDSATMKRIVATCEEWLKSWFGEAANKPPAPSADTPEGALPGTAAGTVAGRCIKAIPDLVSYTTLYKDRKVGGDLVHECALWFGKGGRIPRSVLDSLPRIGGKRVEGFKVKFTVKADGMTDVLVSSEAGLYDSWSGDKGKIDRKEFSVPTLDLLKPSGQKLIDAAIVQLWGAAKKATAAVEAEKGALDKATIMKKLDELAVVQAEYRSLLAIQKQLREEYYAADKALTAKLEGLREGSTMKKITGWMKQLGMKVVMGGQVFVVSPQSGMAIGSNTPWQRMNALVAQARKMGIEIDQKEIPGDWDEATRGGSPLITIKL